jgi:hypothetical protein
MSIWGGLQSPIANGRHWPEPRRCRRQQQEVTCGPQGPARHEAWVTLAVRGWWEVGRRAGFSGDTGGVGFNPFRQRRRSYADYLMVGAALVVCLGLVIWAALG